MTGNPDIKPYRFSELELRRYQTHGIAHATLAEMNPTPYDNRCDILLETLVDIESPAFVRVKETKVAPEIMVATKRITKPTTSVRPHNIVDFEEGKFPVSLRVEWGGFHPGRDYMWVNVTPIYR